MAADIALSRELKPSHAINAAMIGASFTGVGSVLAGIWFIADNGYGLYIYINNKGFTTYSDKLDNDFAEEYGKIELWNGIY